jgi:hypothetical protein
MDSVLHGTQLIVNYALITTLFIRMPVYMTQITGLGGMETMMDVVS